MARELLEAELKVQPEPVEDEMELEDDESSGDEEEETSDDEDDVCKEAEDGDGDNALDETDSEAADESEGSEDSDDDDGSDESLIEIQQPKSKAQKYAQRPEKEQREQTFLEFMANVSDDESDESNESDDTDDELADDTDDELAEQVEAPTVGPTMVSVSIDQYMSKNTGLQNSTVVIDQKRSDANSRFMVDARNIIGVTKWNRGTMSYDTIHYLKVNNLLVGVHLRDKNTGISYEAYGVPQQRLVTEFDNDMAKLLKELNRRFEEFDYQFESNSDAPLLLFNFIKGDDNSNYLHGHTFFLGESILNELGSSVSYKGKRMYRLHPKTKLKDAARKLDQHIRNTGIRATEIKVKNQTFHPIF